MRTLIPGEWYILFRCSDCQTRQILFPDLSEGRARLRAIYKVQCAKCDYTGRYDSEILERYQHPSTSDPQPIHGLAFFALLGLLRSFGWARISWARASGKLDQAAPAPGAVSQRTVCS